MPVICFKILIKGMNYLDFDVGDIDPDMNPRSFSLSPKQWHKGLLKHGLRPHSEFAAKTVNIITLRGVTKMFDLI